MFSALPLAFWQDLAWVEFGLFVAGWVIRVTMLVIVPQRRDPASARAWIMLILLLPWVGLALYLLIGRPRVAAYRLERHAAFQERLAQGDLAQVLPADASGAVVAHQPRLRSTVELAQALTTLPILSGNTATLLDEYECSIDRLVDDIDAAREQVHLLYYIFSDDIIGQRIAQALARAAKRGVICRVLVDGLGSRPVLRRFLPQLRAKGVQAHAISPPDWGHLLRHRRTSRLDLRNHRKIAVIDGNVAYTGSQNLIDADFKPGIQYEELVVRLQGPIVEQLQTVFLSDWYIETHELLAPPSSILLSGAVVAQAVPSGPEYQVEANQRLFISLLYEARRRIVLTTPYFIPDTALLTALETAVLRGVETHLVVSQAADQFLVYQAQCSFYAGLLAMGVQIHLYQPRFLHAKHLSIDDDVIVIGSSNLDRRSFSLNAEISVVFYGEELAAALHVVQDRYFAAAHLLTAKEWEGRSRVSKVVQNMCRLMDALL